MNTENKIFLAKKVGFNSTMVNVLRLLDATTVDLKNRIHRLVGDAYSNLTGAGWNPAEAKITLGAAIRIFNPLIQVVLADHPSDSGTFVAVVGLRILSAPSKLVDRLADGPYLRMTDATTPIYSVDFDFLPHFDDALDEVSPSGVTERMREPARRLIRVAETGVMSGDPSLAALRLACLMELEGLHPRENYIHEPPPVPPVAPGSCREEIPGGSKDSED